jgi:hypothetical protein
MVSNPNPSEQFGPRIVRARLTELTIYDVSEEELRAIERGGPESFYFNLAVFFVSTALSFTVALATTEIKSDRLHATFVIVTVISYAATLVFGVLWFYGFRSRKNTISLIRERKPAAAESIPLIGS